MGSAGIQGDLWGRAPRDWAELQEPMHRPLWEAMLEAAGVASGTRLLDAGCGGGGACLVAARQGARVSGVDAAGPGLTLRRPGNLYFPGLFSDRSGNREARCPNESARR